MIFRIPRGKHRARPLRFGVWWRRLSFTWSVKFTESCRYDLQSADQYDINKLVGIGYLPGHHKDSARFGWRYDTKTEQVEVLAYCYVNGRREIQSICSCDIGKEYVLQMKILSNSYFLAAHQRGRASSIGSTFVGRYHSKKFMYRLGLFFGGQARAPHEMKIELKKSG